MLEEDEQSASRDIDCAVHAGASSTDDSGIRNSHSPVSSQEPSFDGSDVHRDSSTAGSIPATGSTDIQLASSVAASVDSLDEDPWLPVSTRSHSSARVSARNSLIGVKSQSNSPLHCCNSAAATAPHSAVGCDSEHLGAQRCVASSNLQCHCAEKCSQKVPETRRTVDVDEVLNSEAGFRHNLTEIKEGMPANCFDAENDRANSKNDTNHAFSTDSAQHSCTQSNSDHYFPSVRAEALSGGSSGSRPTRKASLNGLRNAVRSVLIHRTSLTSDCPADLADSDPCRSPFESAASEFSDHSAEKASRSTGSKTLSRIDRRSYFGSGRRSQRSGLAVDSVRQSLTHLLRTGDHGSSVVGERMAVSCLERPVSSALTLAGTRRTSRRMLSGDFDDVEAAETSRLQPELSRVESGTNDQSDNESDGPTTATCSSELDATDSFYESRLFDALEVQKNDDGDDDGFDTDSSDGGTYSAESFSDLAPSDDQPMSSASSHRSVDGRVSRQSDPVATDNTGQDDQHAPVAATFYLLRRTVRQRSGSDVKADRLTDGCRCSLIVLQHPSGVSDITDDASQQQQRWKRLSL